MTAVRRVAGCLLAVAIAGCSGGGDPSQSTRTSAGTAGVYFDVSVFKPSGGMVTSQDGQIRCGTAGSACSGRYSWNAQAVLTATADPGYTFGTWGGDCQGTGPCVLVAGADKYVIAVFGFGGEVQHGNFTSPAVHGPAFLDRLGGLPGSLNCSSARCHGPTYEGAGLAPSCRACHASHGWDSWLSNCTFCHGTRAKTGYVFAGDPSRAAPPDAVSQRLTGAAAPARTGSHPQHLTGVTAAGDAWAAPFQCATCHAVPTDLSHVGGSTARATVVLSGAGQASLPASLGTYDAASGTCTTYCHGNGKAPGTSPAFASAGIACDGCHGIAPAGGHPYTGTDVARCAACHPETVGSDGRLLAGGSHLDGIVQGTGACDSCHGFPPDTGAHVKHYGLTGPVVSGYGDTRSLQDIFPSETPTTAPGVYAFGCGNCHPLAFADHNDGVAQVALYDPAAPPGSLKSLAAASAAYDPSAGTCSGVYCHSSGQATPTYRTTPAWTSGAPLTCGSCHENPPRYLSGGPGTPTANSHLGVDDWMWVVGHFGGVGAVGHAETHGAAAGSEASITCQTCHFDTTDPSSTGVSGFYWLDTTGEYEFAGRDPGQAPVSCSACHTGAGNAVAMAGKVLPFKHVNGARDVVFDLRLAVDPSIVYLPAAPNTPTKPYWRANWASVPWVNMVLDGSTASYDLTGATYDPTTKTCTVACHNIDPASGLSTVWGAPFAWTCENCHREMYTY